MDFYRAHLKQVVEIHQAMFRKLLREDSTTADEDLAELFHDIGKTYLQISERINARSHHSLQD